MKIGQILHRYRPKMGGIQNYVYRIKESFDNMGHKVTIYTTDLSLHNAGKPLEDVYYCKTNFSISRNPFSLELIKRIRESNEDIYHLHSPWFIPSFIANQIIRDKPKIMTVHSAEIAVNDSKTWLLNIAYRPFAKQILKDMDFLLVLGQTEKNCLLRNFNIDPKKVHIVPNGIELEKFKDKGDPKSFLEKFQISDDSFKILYVSRLVPQKNQDKLVKAVVKYLTKNNIEVIFIGGGEGDYFSYLKKISDERCHFLGKVDFDDLVSAYKAADLFIFLGSWEGMPTVILEAMAFGLPILTTPVGGIPDIVEEGENGMFVNIPIESNILAQKIMIMMNKVDLNRMSKQNKLKVEKEFKWDIVSKKILTLYEQAMERYP